MQSPFRLFGGQWQAEQKGATSRLLLLGLLAIVSRETMFHSAIDCLKSYYLKKEMIILSVHWACLWWVYWVRPIAVLAWTLSSRWPSSIVHWPLFTQTRKGYNHSHRILQRATSERKSLICLKSTHIQEGMSIAFICISKEAITTSERIIPFIIISNKFLRLLAKK